MPGGLAILARKQFAKLERYNKRRQEIAKRYVKDLKNTNYKLPRNPIGSIWLRFPLAVPRAKELLEYAKKKGILLGDWYEKVVTSAMSMARVKYQKDSCPKAEKFAGKMVNLPTYPTMTNDQVGKVIKFVKEWESIK